MSEWQETDFGRIPKFWELKQIVELKSSETRAIAMGPFGSDIKAENFVDSGVPVIRGTNMNVDKYVDGEFVFLTEDKADELIGSNCCSGDLVFTHRGTIGQVAIIPSNRYERYVISQSGMKLTLNPDLANNDFIFYFFKSKYGQFQLLKYESQVGVPSISNPLTSLKQIEVPIPPLSEQRAIAEILSCFDEKIDLLYRQNKTLEKMAETFFRQFFIEESLEDWEEGILGDLVHIKYGKDHKNLNDGLIPVYGSGGIMRYAETSLYDAESVLIPRKGTLNNVVYINKPFWTVDTMFYTEMKKPNLAKFIYHFVKGHDLSIMNVGSAVPSMTTEVLNNLPLLIPSEKALEDFEKRISSLYSKLDFNQSQIHTLSNMRDILLPKLMSGRVRMKI